MDRVEAMRIFVRVVEQRSFSGAARDMSLSRSTVTEAIQQLEGRLGARLLERTTKKVEPTVVGQTYYDACVVALRAVDDADAAVGSAETRGLVRMSVPHYLFNGVILPTFPDFLREHPGLTVILLDPADAARDGRLADVAVDVADSASEAIAGQAIGSIPCGTYASTAYVADRGEPSAVQELTGHTLIARLSRATGRPLPFEYAGAKKPVVPASMSSAATSFETIASLTEAGLGIAQLPRFLADAAVADGTLVELLKDAEPLKLPVFVIEAQGRHMSAQARVLLDHLGTLLS